MDNLGGKYEYFIKYFVMKNKSLGKDMLAQTLMVHWNILPALLSVGAPLILLCMFSYLSLGLVSTPLGECLPVGNQQCMSFGSRCKHHANMQLLFGLQGFKFAQFSCKARPFPVAAHPVRFVWDRSPCQNKHHSPLSEGLQPGHLKQNVCHFKSSTTG